MRLVMMESATSLSSQDFIFRGPQNKHNCTDRLPTTLCRVSDTLHTQVLLKCAL